MNQTEKPPLPMFSALKKHYEKERREEERKNIEEAKKSQGQLFEEDIPSDLDEQSGNPVMDKKLSVEEKVATLGAKKSFTQADFLADNFHERKEFSDVKLENSELYDYSFDDCVFRNCSFNKVAFINISFSDCEFYNCELILCKQEGTTFDDVFFKSSRLTGINFSDCAEYGFNPNFSDCLLDSCVFYDNTLDNCRITECTLRNTDFSNCRLKKTDFSLTRFQNCTFLGCIMDKADFTSATGYSIDPSANKVKGARFSLPEAASFLKYLGLTIE